MAGFVVGVWKRCPVADVFGQLDVRPNVVAETLELYIYIYIHIYLYNPSRRRRPRPLSFRPVMSVL